MLIQCPKCQAKLELPADVEGKKVRCPSCQEVFRATSEIVTNAIQAGEPESKPPIANSDEADDLPPPRRRSYDDRDYDDPDIIRERDGRDASVEDAARDGMRLAGRLMLVTFYFTLLNVIVNFALSQLTAWGNLNRFGGGRGGAPGEEVGRMIGFAFGIVCSIVIFIPMFAFIYLAGRALLTLGSRAIIITGIVMNGIMVLFLGCGFGFNVMILSNPMMRDQIPFWTIMPTIFLNPLSCLLNGITFILAILALSREPVSRYFQMKAGATYRPR